MVATFAFFLASRPVHILHVIGLVGAGKSRFFREYFPSLPVFDIQTVYRDHQFSPSDLKGDPDHYRQFTDALEIDWANFLQTYDPHKNVPLTFCVGVESSGINHALNALLVPFFPTVLWIKGDPPPASDIAFWKTRPYGVALNTVIQTKLNAGEIHFTHEYSVEGDRFLTALPSLFSTLSPRFKTAHPENVRSLPRTYRCAICHAPFSTESLFDKHMQRHQTS